MSLHSRSLRRRPLAGFTLTELLIVVAIIILLVVATLPRIKYALDESKVRESSRQLNSYMALAKSRAASTGRPCGLWFVSEQIGNPNGVPPNVAFQSTQLYLAEMPAIYSGDVLDGRVYVTAPGTTQPPSFSPPNGPPWDLNFVSSPASMGSMFTFFQVGDTFAIRFDHKGPIFPAQRTQNGFQITGLPILPFPNAIALPPAANGTDPNLNPNLGYSYEIYRTPQRIGAPLALPRGTCVDLAYSGVGNSGTDFYAAQNPVNPSRTPAVLLLFSPDGHVGNVTFRTWDSNNNVYVTISNDAQGTIHFLVGRPEKVGLPLNQSNLWDNNALWVSVGRLTGSVVSTDNAPNVNLPTGTAAQQQAFLTVAREYAITQDVKGGQ